MVSPLDDATNEATFDTNRLVEEQQHDPDCS